MDLSRIRAPRGATHRKKRVGRGHGSGHGKQAGRGGKGQKARTGNMNFGGFEGGQMPLQRRMPKRGFHNPFRVETSAVNVGALGRFDAGAVLDPDALAEAGLARKGRLLKILGDGALDRALTVRAHAFSPGARSKIEAAGGRCEVLEATPARATEAGGPAA